MTSTLERLDVATSGFRSRLQGCGPEDLDRPSPCAGWRAGDVVEHVIDVLAEVGALVAARAEEAPDGASAGVTPLERFDRAAGALHDDVADPVRATAVVESPFGTMAFKQLVSSVVVHDVLVHTWDLARATGGDEVLDHELVVHTLGAMTPFDESLRDHGFAAKVPVGEDADDQTRLLCFLGRRP